MHRNLFKQHNIYYSELEYHIISKNIQFLRFMLLLNIYNSWQLPEEFNEQLL